MHEGLSSMSRDQQDRFARAARDFQAEPDEAARFRLAVELAVQLVPGCQHAGVTLVEGRQPSTATSTDQVVQRCDELQYEFDEGPCLDTVRSHDTVLSQDLARENRWPRWSPRVNRELGIHSVLALLLYTTSRSYGALNLYAERRNAYHVESVTVAHALAAHLAIAVASSREIDHRGIAMGNRTVIGQAEGILMERLNVSAEQAFAYLRRESQQSNRKLLAICTELVETRRLHRSA